jgi:pimeloyl-ACP methyl ester carboxylesterase
VNRLAALSPRRRTLVIGVAAAVLAVAVVVVIQMVVERDTGSHAPQDRPGTVVLVPGYGGGAGGLRVLARRLQREGRTAVVVELPDGGIGDMERQAQTIDRYVTDALRGAPSVDIVGHSAGGVAAHLWAREHDGAAKARRIITLGSPHHGADLAGAGSALGACPAACEQLAPGSAMLRRLGDHVGGAPAWMSLWTTRDDTVDPASSRLVGAVDVELQKVCPGATTGHSSLPSDPQVMGIVMQALGPGELAAPRACPSISS